jgi:PPOX class probable F420-dependent enzyme
MMSVQIPDSHKDLIDGPVCATVTTVFDDGQPQSSVVWTKLDDDVIKFSVTSTRQKTLNMQKNPKVSVLAIDPQNPYRYLEVRGDVSLSEEGAYDLIDGLAKAYVDKDSYYGGVAPAEAKDKEKRLVVTVTPTRVVAHGG